MFRRPWHVWLTYVAILAVLLPGFAWLSLRVVELDRNEWRSRLQADREERIGLALWRMETVAMPIVAAEAARPHFVYTPFQIQAWDEKPIASPLLFQAPDYVRLNFQFNADNSLQCVQCPSGADRALAEKCGVTAEELSRREQQVQELKAETSFDDLFALLPEIHSSPVLPSATGPIAAMSPVQQGLQRKEYVTNTNTLNVSQAAAEESPSARDYSNRSAKLQSIANQSALQQRQVAGIAAAEERVVEGTSRPVWIGDKLLLARRVSVNGANVIQGCWLDWPQLRSDLLRELRQVCPEAGLEPVKADEVAPGGRMLASLPVSIIVPDLAMAGDFWTPTTVALAVAWRGLGLACLAIALILYAVTSISERRAAFVSAVTHELRTPLTTFQMYTEMLVGGMIDDEARRQSYLKTLQGEAGRLRHLIDNVLAFSRLERRRHDRRSEAVTVGDLLERVWPQVEQRVALSEMEVVRDVADCEGCRVAIEQTVFDQVLMNLVDNACKYARQAEDRTIRVRCGRSPTGVEVVVSDCGPGIAPDARRRLFQPFSKSDAEAARSAPGVGLGLSISRGLLREFGGDLRLDPDSPGRTCFVISLPCAGE